jgi:hypothetical protein
MVRALVVVAVLASPLFANALSEGGSCEYASGNPSEASLKFCTQARDLSACQAAAARKAAPGWLETHPATFKSGGDCTDGGKAFQKAKSSAKKGEKAGSKVKGKKGSDGTASDAVK